ncbi:MetS family NSS transporter small subunit [Methanosarcina siciliae]|nr:MetS family NSS transporter small subunit [Methanosarcina siciliae]
MLLSTGSFLMAVFGFVILYGGLGLCLSIALRKRMP